MAIKIAGTEVINDDKELVLAKLAEIDSSIAVTAVDVFVYDTSKDSDGGAWRKRTQGTSWYNETLNTATRGSRREFPAVAVIVAEATKVTIYDGDDPSLPMWMEFNGGAGNMMAANSCSSVAMLNGRLTVGNFLYDVVSIDFAGDRAARAGVSTIFGPYLGNVLTRNSNSGWASNTASFFTNGPIVNRTVNDVAMTVLPNAPIDAATGLPVPTIAVATDGGVSVIKDDGTVVDSDATSAHNFVDFDAQGILYIGRQGSNQIRSYRNYDSDGFSVDHYYATDAPPAISLQYNAAQITKALVTVGNNFSGGCDARLFSVSPDYTNKVNGMVTWVTSTYNTGWMNGDIKGAFLSDTDDTDLVGSGELVTNGTFDTDTSGWTPTDGASLSVVSGALRITDADFGYAHQDISTTVGETYVVSLDGVGKGSASDNYYLQLGTTANKTSISNNVLGTSDGSFSVTFVATDTTTRVTVAFGSVGGYADFDNISAKLADADRSVNANGLIVNGTVTRSPVATGADLVAYSGFSTSNYLEQPYNSDLDFGTGDFCVMGWAKTVDSAGNNPLMCRGVFSGGWSGSIIRLRYSAGSAQFTITDDGFVTLDQCSVSGQANGVWQHLVGVRRGNTIELWLDGKLMASTPITNATASLSNSLATLQVGVRQDFGASMSGSLALLRISGTAPTASQISRIYNDEKVLFQENAQATLYGTSDAVTALAHDDATNLLHVGTSAGRSVFQGLRRVENTTTAVGTAISASNGLVVEE